jgi:hypothetical protein
MNRSLGGWLWIARMMACLSSEPKGVPTPTATTTPNLRSPAASGAATRARPASRPNAAPSTCRIKNAVVEPGRLSAGYTIQLLETTTLAVTQHAHAARTSRSKAAWPVVGQAVSGRLPSTCRAASAASPLPAGNLRPVIPLATATSSKSCRGIVNTEVS